MPPTVVAGAEQAGGCAVTVERVQRCLDGCHRVNRTQPALDSSSRMDRKRIDIVVRRVCSEGQVSIRDSSGAG
jgi:hypothetical protein